jgi:hypothetical protein
MGETPRPDSPPPSLPLHLIAARETVILMKDAQWCQSIVAAIIIVQANHRLGSLCHFIWTVSSGRAQESRARSFHADAICRATNGKFPGLNDCSPGKRWTVDRRQCVEPSRLPSESRFALARNRVCDCQRKAGRISSAISFRLLSRSSRGQALAITTVRAPAATYSLSRLTQSSGVPNSR